MKRSMSIYRVAFATVFFISAIVSTLLLERLHRGGKETTSIAIIGGADGPTALYSDSKSPLVRMLSRALAFFIRPLVLILARLFR